MEMDHGLFEVSSPYFKGKLHGTLKLHNLGLGHLSDTSSITWF